MSEDIRDIRERVQQFAIDLISNTKDIEAIRNQGNKLEKEFLGLDTTVSKLENTASMHEQSIESLEKIAESRDKQIELEFQRNREDARRDFSDFKLDQKAQILELSKNFSQRTSELITQLRNEVNATAIAQQQFNTEVNKNLQSLNRDRWIIYGGTILLFTLGQILIQYILK